MNDVITLTEENALALLQDDKILTAVVKAEARVTAFIQIKKLSLKATTPLDWANLGGKPYLQDTGAEKVAGLFSPTIGVPIITKEFAPDGHYTYFCDGLASWGGKEIPVMGSRSSKDKFFVQYDYETIDGKRKRVELSIEELISRIDPGDVRKSALTNYRNNAIKDVLGLEGITWADLADAGIEKDDVSSVEYGNQEMDDKAKDKKAEIVKMMTEMHGKNYKKQLEELTANTDKNGKEWPGVKNLDRCSEKKLPIVHRQVKDVYDKWNAGNKKETPTTPANELLGKDSKRFKDAIKALEAATTSERVDELLALANGVFTPDAIKDLKEVGDNLKESFNAKF
jgi:hypothetical protein